MLCDRCEEPLIEIDRHGERIAMFGAGAGERLLSSCP